MRGPAFDQARTPEGFAKARVDGETGTVTWPCGADLAPDTLYERVRTGAWPDQHVAAESPSPTEELWPRTLSAGSSRSPDRALPTAFR